MESFDSEDEINGGYLVDPERNTPTSLKGLRIGSLLSNRMKRVSTIKPEYDKIDEKNAAFFFNRWRKRSKIRMKCKKLITKYFKDKELRGELDYRFRPWIHQDQLKSYFYPALIRARSRIHYKRRNFLVFKRNYKMINSLRKVLYHKKLDCFQRWKRRSKWPKVLPFHLLKAFQRFKLKINHLIKRNNTYKTSFDIAIEAKNIWKKLTKFNGITPFRALYIMNVTALHRKAQWYATKLFSSKVIKKFQRWIQLRRDLRTKIACKMIMQRVRRRRGGGFSPYKTIAASRIMIAFHALISRIVRTRNGMNKALVHWGHLNFIEMHRILMIWKKNRNDDDITNINYNIKIGKKGLVNLRSRLAMLKIMLLDEDKGERHHQEKRLREALFTLLDHCTESRATKEPVATPSSPTKSGALIISVSDLTTSKVKMHETAEAGVLLMAHGVRRSRALQRGFRQWRFYFQIHKRDRESSAAGHRMRLIALIRRWRFLSTNSGINGHIFDKVNDEAANIPILSLERFLESSILKRKQKHEENEWCPTGVHLPVYRRRDRVRSFSLAMKTRTAFWWRQWLRSAKKNYNCNLLFKHSAQFYFHHKCKEYIHNWQMRIRTRGLDRFVIPIQDSLARRILLPRAIQEWRVSIQATKHARINLEVANVRAFTIISNSTISHWLRWTGRRSLLRHKQDAFRAVHHPSYPSLCRCVSQFSRTARNIIQSWHEWSVPRRAARIAAFHVRGLVNVYRVTRCMDTFLDSYERQVVRNHGLKRSLVHLSWLRSLSEDKFTLLKCQLRLSLNIKAGYAISPDREEEEFGRGERHEDIDLKIPLIDGSHSYHWIIQLVVSDRTRTSQSLQRRSAMFQRFRRWRQFLQRTKFLRRLEARVAKWRHSRPDYCVGWTFWRWRSSWAALVTQRGLERYNELKRICGPVIRTWKQWIYRVKIRGGAKGYRYRRSRSQISKHASNLNSSPLPFVFATVRNQSNESQFNTILPKKLGMSMSKALAPPSPIPVQTRSVDDSYNLSVTHLSVIDTTTSPLTPITPLHKSGLGTVSPSRHSLSRNIESESESKYADSAQLSIPVSRSTVSAGHTIGTPALPVELSRAKGKTSKVNVKRNRPTKSSVVATTATTTTTTNATNFASERSRNAVVSMATIDMDFISDRGYESKHQSRRWYESTI